jgi:hypothetical protein
MPHSFASAYLVRRAISEVPPCECRERQFHHEDDSEYRESLGSKGLLRRHAAEGTTAAIRHATGAASSKSWPRAVSRCRKCSGTPAKGPPLRSGLTGAPCQPDPPDQTTGTPLHPASIRRSSPSTDRPTALLRELRGRGSLTTLRLSIPRVSFRHVLPVHMTTKPVNDDRLILCLR